MWSRRDQIQAYQFVRRRTVSAIVVGDANHAESPIRRTIIGLLAGSVCLVLLLAVFCVYGFLRPGGSAAWRKAGAIIEEKESGARFVLGADQALHPVLNYSSARLITGGSGQLTRVSRKSLTAAGRGLAVGIPGAPDALPAPDRLLRDPWLACSSRPGTAGPGGRPRLTVIIGRPAQTRRVTLGSGAALVVQAGTRTYVVTDGRRFRIGGTEPGRILDALGMTQAPRVEVDARWLSTVPAGPDLGYPAIASRTVPSTAVPVAGARIGQVFVQRIAESEGSQYFVLMVDGLSPVSTTQARLILGDPRTSRAYPGTTPSERGLAPSELAGARRSATDLDATLYPRTPPAALTFPTSDDVVLCSSPRGFTDGVPAVIVSLAFAVPVPAGVRPLASVGSDPGANGAEPVAIAVPPGSGAVVRSVPTQGVATGPVYLVTDEGRRYAVPDAESRKALGFEAVRPESVPAQFLDLLPTGPALDRAAAARFAGGPTSTAD